MKNILSLTPSPKKEGRTHSDNQLPRADKIQNHGVLIACTLKEKIISHASDNTTLFFDTTAADMLNTSIFSIMDKDIIGPLFDYLEKREVAYQETTLKDQSITIVAHKVHDAYVFELEVNVSPINSFKYQMRLAEAATKINGLNNIVEKCDYAVELIQKYFAYDRVMVYQFDPEWNREIIAERKQTHLESWLGLSFPAEHLPEQARRLLLNLQIKTVKDINSEGVNVLTSNEQPNTASLDLSLAELSAPSPIHIKNLLKMGVSAVLSSAIVKDSELWGLIICFNYNPKVISFYERFNFQFLSQILATSINLNTTNKVLEEINSSFFIQNNLVDQIDLEGDIIKGLSEFRYTINDLTSSSAAAIYINNKLTTVGLCPSPDEVVKLIHQIKNLTDTQLYTTNCLSNDFPEAKRHKKTAAGVLCTFISTENSDAILWFKPEATKARKWAGQPKEPITRNNHDHSIQTKSLQTQSIEQQATAEPWEDHEISEAVHLQKNIIIIMNYEEVKRLNDQLKMAYSGLESFSYSISHDLRSPLRGIDGFAHILKEDYYDKLDDFGKSSVDTIISSVTKMNTLIDDILRYSSLGKTDLDFSSFPLDELIYEILPDLQTFYSHVKIEVACDLPNLFGDRKIIVLLIKNLLENAVKYSSRTTNPLVTVGYIGNNTFFVKDNGIGFDMKHKNQIFGVFERLVNHDYPGSGIGLAIAKRIVDKHQGEIWADSEKGVGTTFYFRLATRG